MIAMHTRDRSNFMIDGLHIGRTFKIFDVGKMKTLNLRGFVELKPLGKGTYGNVYKARRESDGAVYAVKAVSLASLNHREMEDSVNEIRLMASFNSPFIIRFYEAFCDCKRLCVVTEYCRLGDLAHLIDRKKKKHKQFREEVIWRFLLELLQGLRVLHSCGVVHRDLKSANILLSAPDLLKIGDLGISTVLTKRELARTQIGTPLYIAPEVWKRRPYNQKCDMWSLGVLLYEMMTFAYPFVGRGSGDLAQRVCLGRYTIPPGPYSSDLISIVRRLLQVNPTARPSAQEVLNLQAVKLRMPLLEPFMSLDGELREELLSTIKVPTNMRHVNLPNCTYGKKVDIVKPLEQRMHVKKGAKKDLPWISSPDLQLIADLELWSPNHEESHLAEETQEEVVKPPPPAAQPRASAPNNPRFRHRIG
jgi:NIMA (never in mitosis gene a)-related kinase